MRIVSPDTTCRFGTCLELIGLIGRHVHDQVDAARHHFGDLRLPVGNEADLDLVDFGCPFGLSLK